MVYDESQDKTEIKSKQQQCMIHSSNRKGDKRMSEYKLKIGKMAEKTTAAYQKVEDSVVGGYKKVEDTVVGGYKKIEDAVVGGCKKIEDSFVEKFLEKVDEEDQNEDVRG